VAAGWAELALEAPAEFGSILVEVGSILVAFESIPNDFLRHFLAVLD